MDRDLLPIGQFSKMTRLSVKALRLYDEIGLLAPGLVDPDSGYRYYRLGQAVEAEAIRILRSLDMPLDGIRKILAGDPTTTREILEAHHQRLAAQLERHHRMLTFTEDLLQGRTQLMPYEVQLKKMPDQQVAAVRRQTSLETISATIEAAFGTLMGQLGPQGVAPSGPPFILFHDMIDEKTSGDIELCLPLDQVDQRDQHDQQVEVSGDAYLTRIPGGEIAATLHKGPYDQVGPAYHALTAWAKNNGRELVGAPRECYLNSPADVTPDEQLTEVRWPLR